MWLLLLLQPLAILLLALSALCGGAKKSRLQRSNSGSRLGERSVERKAGGAADEPDNDGSSTQSSVLKQSSCTMKKDDGSSDNPNRPPSPNDDKPAAPGQKEAPKQGGGEETKADADSKASSSVDLSSSSIIDDLISLGSTEEKDSYSEVYVAKDDRITAVLIQLPDCTNLTDSGQEAKLRHIEMQNYVYRPLFNLGAVVTRKTYKDYFRQKGSMDHQKEKEQPYTKEEREAMLARMTDKYKEATTAFVESAEAHVIYGFDEIRGDGDFDENTMDDMTFQSRERLEDEIDQALANGEFPKAEAAEKKKKKCIYRI